MASSPHNSYRLQDPEGPREPQHPKERPERPTEREVVQSQSPGSPRL